MTQSAGKAHWIKSMTVIVKRIFFDVSICAANVDKDSRVGPPLMTIASWSLGLPDFRGQVDYVSRLRSWQASSYLIGLMFPRAVCLRWVL